MFTREQVSWTSVAFRVSGRGVATLEKAEAERRAVEMHRYGKAT